MRNQKVSRWMKRKNPQPPAVTGFMAEMVGFEPTKPCGLTVFKTAAFNPSATSPRCVIKCGSPARI